MAIRELDYKKITKLYKIKYNKINSTIVYKDTIVHKFDTKKQDYILYKVLNEKKERLAYYWSLDKLYIYDNNEKDIINWNSCRFKYNIDCYNVYKYSEEYNAHLFESKTSEYSKSFLKKAENLIIVEC